MPPKKTRLSKGEIENIFKQSRFVNSANLTLKFIQSDAKNSRFSFLTPKNIGKKAVLRNKLRRRGYFALKNQQNIPKNIVGAFVFGKNSAKAFGGKKNKSNNPVENLENEIKVIFNKLN